MSTKRKRAEVAFEAPSDWKSVWERIESFRKANVAPVDTVGCERLADKDPNVYRWQTLVALMLSSQTKDGVTADAMANLKQHAKDNNKEFSAAYTLTMTNEELDDCIKKVGFHNRKTQYLKKAARRVVDYGNVPDDLDSVLEFEGVGPKMAYLFFNTVSPDKETRGIGVDTHVHRISQRLGWTKNTKTPEDTRAALEGWLPKSHWAPVNALLVGFGQTLCTPIKPKCASCPVGRDCPSYSIKK
jgi:endonuclease-3